ncbi:hypothetical protein GPALN_002158 [Globodera pallida]|uniref:Chorein_N domain-containing protein n=1 Tax=Globodera pallida TaxID=36090 RepID=A0A183C596_GLOPA|nr:hypothetical protein GPALN_002158 [Globodera pallida]
MIFKSFIVDFLNEYLDTYVNTLSESQLDIGIWGGDVQLNQLDIKETALDEFDLPVRLSFGYIQSLALKIPWAFWSKPIVAEISDVYLIFVPNQNEQQLKQKKLLLETRRNRQESSPDDLWDMLISQMSKKIRMHIKRVHIRYEDKVPNRERPFSTVIDSLDFQTTDKNFKPIVQRVADQVYNLVSMRSLRIFWSPTTTLISDLNNTGAIIDALRQTIDVNENEPEEYEYVLEPCTIEAKMKFCTPAKDGLNWTAPKIDLSKEIRKLGLAISKQQYQELLKKFEEAGDELDMFDVGIQLQLTEIEICKRPDA